MKRFGYVMVKRKKYQGRMANYLKSEKFIKEVYDKSKDKEVFDEAIDRVGDKMIAKNFQTNAVLYKAVGEKIAGQNQNWKK